MVFFLLQKMEKDCGKGQERRVAGGKKHLWKIFSNFFFLFSSFKKEGETESKIGSEAERERGGQRKQPATSKNCWRQKSMERTARWRSVPL